MIYNPGGATLAPVGSFSCESELLGNNELEIYIGERLYDFVNLYKYKRDLSANPVSCMHVRIAVLV